jgi:hypothetical protein
MLVWRPRGAHFDLYQARQGAATSTGPPVQSSNWSFARLAILIVDMLRDLSTRASQTAYLTYGVVKRMPAAALCTARQTARRRFDDAGVDHRLGAHAAPPVRHQGELQVAASEPSNPGPPVPAKSAASTQA